jgi:hypothetical protein
MTQAVITDAKTGELLVAGVHDAYGRVGHYDVYRTHGYDGGGVTWWHAACWAAAGDPSKGRGRCDWSADQGWFHAPETYAGLEMPAGAADVLRLRTEVAARQAAEADTCA